MIERAHNLPLRNRRDAVIGKCGSSRKRLVSSRFRTVVASVAALVLLAACSSGQSVSGSGATPDSPAAEPALSLTDVQQPPEDILSLDGTDWVLLSSMTAGDHPGGLSLFDRQTSTESALWPVPEFVYDPDLEAFPGCDTPPDEARAATHGINAVQTGPGTFDLFVVYHGSRESIEVFDLDVTGDKPEASWRGCAVLPEGTAANSVVGLAGGGIAITNFADPREPLYPQLFSGEPSGSVWTWERAGGWTEVPGSEAFGPNGIEASADGETLYVAETMKKRVVSIPTAGGSLSEVGTMAFLPDNLRWNDSGSLLTTGSQFEPLTAESIQSCRREGVGCISGFIVVEIDPTAGTFETVYSTKTPDYQYPTVAAQVGSGIWVGSNAVSQIAVLSGVS